jgi:LasA protease
MRKPLVMFALLLLSVLACVRNQPQIIVITATFEPASQQAAGFDVSPEAISTQLLSPVPAQPVSNPTPDPTRPISAEDTALEYVVQPGDTLFGIATANGVTIESILAVNNLINPDNLSVGQVIKLPEPPDVQTSEFKILPDSRLIRGPGSSSFDVFAFVEQQPGYIRLATDEVKDEILTGAQIVQRVSLEFSVDPRLLLALLEYKSAWLTNPNPADDAKIYPMGAQASAQGFDRNGLYRQLTWAADQMNLAYYGWKTNGLTTLEFDDGTRLLYAPGLNAGTVGLQYLFSRYNSYANWQRQVSQDGFYRTYIAYFGDPFANATEPLVPNNIEQPALELPFSPGETWFYTGGPHGGWGTGSAWAAIDFAPPDDRPEGSALCYVSDYWATAVAPGIIARSGDGSVVLDLDGDGDETTGWSILYLHLGTPGRIEAGTAVQIGDKIGRPSCEGGFSTATHMHIARRYNGEWIPAYCHKCVPGQERPPFVMSGWMVIGYINQEYQGYMTNGSEQRLAEQGRLTPENRVSR